MLTFELQDARCLITFASGNWAQEGPLGQNADECVTYPASLENVLAIGAVTPNGHRSIYSDYGSKLDFVAPSNDLNSSGSRSYFGVRTIDRMGSNGYSRYDYHSGFGGTSAATPAAAGAIALLLSAHPNLTRTEAVAVLQKTAKDLNTSGFDLQTGYGLINTAEAITQAGNTGPVDPCASKNGDTDNDGICDADDCHPGNAFYPANPGSSCNDNDDSTENDKVSADGCGCEGEPIACYHRGGDLDGDGYCLLDDCDDENANIPAAQDSPCDDNDDSTENDVIQADGCTCTGTLINNENNSNDNTDDNTTNNQGDQEDEGSTNGDGQDCSTPDNLALQGSASQSSTFFTFAASRAIDGDKSKTHYSQTNYSRDPYWELDLGLLAELSQVNVHLKSAPRSTVYLFVSENDLSGKSFEELMTMANLTIYELNSADSEISLTANAQYLRVQTPGFQSVALIETEAFGCEATSGFAGAEASDVNLNERVFENELTINAYPNPTSGDAFVQFRNSLGKSGELSIYNSLGVKVFQQSMKQLPIIPMHIDFGSVENGIYILELKSGNQRLTQKLIVN